MPFDPKIISDVVLRAVFEGIVKDYKSDTLFETPGYDRPICPVPSIPTGSVALDLALGIGGIPQGRITIFAGEPGCGKSTLALELIKNSQELFPKKINVYVDMEAGAFTEDYAYAIGIDLDPNKFIVVRPDYAEQGLEIVYRLISTGKVGVVIWDSIAGAYSKEAAENSAEDNNSRAGIARLLSENLKKLANKCGKTGTAVILINQIRTQMTATLSWNDISGGRAQKFYSSVRIDLSKAKVTDFSGKVDRETITAKIPRNKTAPQYKMAEFDIKLGEGILKEANTLDLGAEKGIIGSKGGGWYYFHDLSTGEEIASCRGRDKAVDFLVENPEFTETINRAILGVTPTNGYEVDDDLPNEEVLDHIDPDLDDVPVEINEPFELPDLAAGVNQLLSGA
jgi:recombination protein RecA